ncbi:MAG TPA: pilus assembly protein TadG-related protein [Beijerinckiaceae bacterium]|jgi:Flp pilus assembly protein TadG
MLALPELSSLFRRFGPSCGGNVLLIFGFGAPLLFGAIGVAVDYSTWASQTAKLRSAADLAALAATRELQVGNPDEARIQSVAQSIVAQQIHVADGDGPVAVATTPIRSTAQGPIKGVKVTLTQRKNAIMSRLVTPELTDIEVSATAQMAGGTKVCVVGLDEAAPDTIRLDDQARISAGGCSVYVNSKSTTALRAENGSQVVSMLACTSGGYKSTSSANFAPRAPTTDCPKTPDPLADRPAPPVGSCLFSTFLKIQAVTRTLNPGTYCGGLYIERGARVTLNPGIYVIKDGPLIVGPGPLLSGAGAPGLSAIAALGDPNHDANDDGTAASTGWLKGTGVGFYFTGDVKPNKKTGQTVVMRFEPNSLVEITAPTSGPMAGLLFHEDRTAIADRRFEILSDSARRLVGTIYIPRGVFSVSANQTVADLSEYTAIVTKRMELFQAPNLVLNTRYTETQVPVPEGLGPNSGKARLVQ